jgi:hypothetical protein
MGLIDQLDIKEINSVYLFANTPKYLYRHLRHIQSVQELSQRATLQNLVDEYNKITSPTTRSSEDIAAAYALLIAVTFWEYQKALATFEKFDLSRLEWGNDIKDIFKTNAPINTIVGIGAKANIPPNNLEATGSSTSTASYEYTHNNRKEGKT